MTEDFVIRSGDTLPDVSTTLSQSDGAAPDLTGATVAFKLRGADVEYDEVSQPATITDADDAKVYFDWSTLTPQPAPGRYFGRFVVTYPSGQIESYPNAGTGHLIRVAS